VIVPRWEWRTFGERFGAAEDRLAELTPTRAGDSDELYIVSSRGEGSIKVRGGVLDVKRLEQVSDEGLEQWRPVAKAEFPIAATDVAELLAALDVAVPALDRNAYDLDELVDELVRPSADLFSVSVHKRRAHYALAGCMAELTDVLAGSRATRTIAVEAEDPALVRAAVEELGLWSRPNVSFPRGLKALVGF
jgi:exopolyphosphatase / guanosine-5'-triphosphate,3'-diphosphate pyrophosphatase